MNITFTMDKGWKRMARALDEKKFHAQIRKHVSLETRRNALRLVKAARKGIQSGKFAPNAPLTTFIKGSSKPLVDNGDLFKAIAHKQKSWDEAFVGILQTSDVHNIAKFLHEGGSIKVTAKMRGLFKILWLVSEGADPSILTGRARELWNRKPGGWLPLKDSTTVIRVPARPFMESAFEDDAVKAEILAAWERAVQRAFRDATEQAKK